MRVKEPIRILQVIGRMDRGGAETMLMNLYRNIDRQKVQFDFIVHTKDKCAYDDEIRQMGGKIFNIPRFNGINIFYYLYCWMRLLKKHKEYKIVHGHNYNIAAIYLMMSKFLGRYTIAHSHSTSNGSGIKPKIKNIFCFFVKYFADYKMACSIEAGKWLFGENILKSNNFHVLNNAIDLKKYSLEYFTKINNEIVFGHVGRFVEEKNHKFLIQVFKEYIKLNANAKLLLIGKGILEPEIRKLVDKLNLNNKVSFLGIRSDVDKLLKEIDVFVFPSIYEGLPVVLIEAQAAGTQCFISDIITNEVCVTDCIHKLSLNETPTQWAERIFNTKVKRENTYYKLKDAGYDITDTSKWLEQFYLSKYMEV